jgi:tetratricopeptide (TPR) repeat protein
MPTKFRNVRKPQVVSNLLTTMLQEKLQQAIAFHQNGQLPQAQALYEEILTTQPKHFDSLHLLGVIAYQTKQYQRAADLIGKAIELYSKNAAFYCNRGNALKELNQLDAAIASYDRAIALNPNFAEAYSNRGVTLQELKQLNAAVASFDKAIALKPDYAEAYSNRGNALKELKQLDAALASCDKAIALKPGYAEAHSNRGNALKGLGQLEAALASYDKAIALKPDYAEAYSNRGNALQALQQLHAAIASYDKAIALRPDYAEAFSHRGIALQELQQLDAALESYDKAIALKPGYADAHWNKSLALLLFGYFDRGWEEYEWRWKIENSQLNKRNFLKPLWLGSDSLAGKTILLHSEQGFGDTIQFCRYAEKIRDLGAQVILEVKKPILSLLASLEGVSQLVTDGSTLSAFDYQCPLLSLPLAFKSSIDTIPNSSKYLRVESGRIAQWQTKLGEKEKPRIGLVWSGSATHKNDHNRSLLLSHLIQHLPAGFQYVSLQKDIRGVDQQTLQSNPQILDFANDVNDFSDTAALCEAMDLVISVDTSVAHLAGALGKLTWVLLPFTPDWRWLLERTDSPWYPSVRLYRQEKIADWDSVLERVKADLLHSLRQSNSTAFRIA